MRKVCWTAEELDVLRDMASAGMSQRDAAAKLGVSLNRLKAKSWKAGIHFRGKAGPRCVADWDKARELAASGCWLTKGARILGVHHTTALHIARKMGFKWAPAPKMGRPAKQLSAARVIAKPFVYVSVTRVKRQAETERIERMLRLAGRCA